MEIPGNLTCLLRNLYAGQEATVRTRPGNGLVHNWQKVHQGCIIIAETLLCQRRSYCQSCGFSCTDRCESWTTKKLSVEELMLSNCGAGEDSRVLWTARRSNQSILKKINPEYSLEGLMLKHHSLAT